MKDFLESCEAIDTMFEEYYNKSREDNGAWFEMQDIKVQNILRNQLHSAFVNGFLKGILWEKPKD